MNIPLLQLRTFMIKRFDSPLIFVRKKHRCAIQLYKIIFPDYEYLVPVSYIAH